MKMGGGDGASNDRTGVKTSQDESAFVVAGALVARVWLAGGVHSRSSVVEASQ